MPPMDPEELRKALLRENMASDEPDEEVFQETDDLGHMMRNEAQRIAAQFTDTADSSERRRLRDRYAKIEKWLNELRALEASSAPESQTQKQTLRTTVLDEFRLWRAGGAQQRARQRDIERERKQLGERAKPGAAQAAHKRIKDEIEYLLKNYTPSNEYKIEALIDKWRTSGDPNYDPSIKIRLRNARRKKNSSDYAL